MVFFLENNQTIKHKNKIKQIREPMLIRPNKYI